MRPDVRGDGYLDSYCLENRPWLELAIFSSASRGRLPLRSNRGSAARPACPIAPYRDHSCRPAWQNCSNRSLCNLPLASIPAGQSLEVRNVSCRSLIGTQNVETPEASFDVLTQFGQVTFSESVVPVVLGRSGVGTFFSLSQPTTFFLRASGELGACARGDGRHFEHARLACRKFNVRRSPTRQSRR